jgi:hypothetical protein
MFERFTGAARETVFFARAEAGGYGSPQIETEHFLLALLREGEGLLRRWSMTCAGRSASGNRWIREWICRCRRR